MKAWIKTHGMAGVGDGHWSAWLTVAHTPADAEPNTLPELVVIEQHWDDDGPGYVQVTWRARGLVFHRSPTLAAALAILDAAGDGLDGWAECLDWVDGELVRLIGDPIAYRRPPAWVFGAGQPTPCTSCGGRGGHHAKSLGVVECDNCSGRGR